MRRSTNLAILVIAVVLGGVAAFLARSWLQSHSTRSDAQKTVSILVASDTLAFGAPISATDVREIDWPAQSKPEGAFAKLRGTQQEWPTDHPFPVCPRRADYRLEGERAGPESLSVDGHREGQAGRDRCG